MNTLSSILTLASLALVTPATWAAQTTAAPSTAHNGDAWMLALAGLAALLFIGRRQGSKGQTRGQRPQHPQHPGAMPHPPMPQPPTLPTAAAETRY